MHNTFYKKYIRFFGIVSGGIAIDQVTKYYVLTYFNKCVEICEWIRFLPTYNTGVSWGLFSKLGKTFKWIFFGISTTLIILFFRIFLTDSFTNFSILHFVYRLFIKSILLPTTIISTLLCMFYKICLCQ